MTPSPPPRVIDRFSKATGPEKNLKATLSPTDDHQLFVPDVLHCIYCSSHASPMIFLSRFLFWIRTLHKSLRMEVVLLTNRTLSPPLPFHCIFLRSLSLRHSKHSFFILSTLIPNSSDPPGVPLRLGPPRRRPPLLLRPPQRLAEGLHTSAPRAWVVPCSIFLP